MIEDIEKYLDARIKKAENEIKFLARNEQMFISCKAVIIELKKAKEYIKRRKGR